MFFNKIINFTHPDKRKLIYSLYYKSRYLIFYTLIGVISIFFELLVRLFLIQFNIEDFASSILSLPASIILAFILNIKFNFKIQQKKIKQSLLLFFLICIFSFVLQQFLKSQFVLTGIYEYDRFLISGTCFLFFYILHRKFSFRSYVKVGVAIYANGVDDIRNIYEKIGPYPDFIHVDIVDNTFLENAKEVKSYKLEIIKALWPDKEIHVHIMSKNPSKWINIVKDYSDKIFFHFEIDENINDIISQHKDYKKFLGLAVSVNTNFEDYKPSIKLFDNLLFLTIKKPGYSGQQLLESSYTKIDKINTITKNRKFNLCVDGGINSYNINNINSEEIVSGSFILRNENPIETLLKLKFNT